MKKVKVNFNKQLENQLIIKLNKNKKNINEIDTESILKPIKFHLKKTLKICKSKDPEALNLILGNLDKKIIDNFNFFSIYIIELGKKGLTASEIKRKEKSYIKLIARRLQGEMYVNFLKHISNKVTDYYQWETMEDDRVRRTHQELAGKIFKISNSKILPQQEEGCRCGAVLFIGAKKIHSRLEKLVNDSNVNHKNNTD